MGVAQPEFAAMERRDGRRQAEAQAGTRQGAAGIEPHEALHGVLALGLGDAGAVIGDAEQHLIALARASIRICLASRLTTAPSGLRPAGLPYLIAFSTRLASAWLISSRLP